MEKLNVYTYVMLGVKLSTLNLIKEGFQLSTLVFLEQHDIRQVQALLAQLSNDENSPLTSSRITCKTLHDELEVIFPRDLKTVDLERTITAEEERRIARFANIFDVALGTDLIAQHNYYIPQVSIYSIDTLLQRGELLIGPEARAVLPPELVPELRQFGQSFAFGVPTAAGFHLVRALEWVLRYYVLGVGETLGDVKDRSWGNYLKKIEAMNGDPRIVAVWRNLKREYRDDLMHPELHLSMEQVFALIETAHTLIRGTVADVEGRKDPTSPLAKLYPKP